MVKTSMASMEEGVNTLTVLVIVAIVGAGVVQLMSGVFIYDPEVTNSTLGFETGSEEAELITTVPLILLALGLLGAFVSFLG